MTGKLLQEQQDPFVRDLQRTEKGSDALEVEREHGGDFFITNGMASFHDEESNTIVIGLGPNFDLGARFTQKKWIHEKTHQEMALTGKAANPLDYEQEEYAELKMEEEALAESNGMDHLMELGLERPLRQSESIYVDAYEQGYRDLQMVKKWASDDELREEGRKRGKAALLQAFKDKKLVPSTVPQDLTKSKEELYGYEEYYKDQWQRAWDMQKHYEYLTATELVRLSINVSGTEMEL